MRRSPLPPRSLRFRVLTGLCFLGLAAVVSPSSQAPAADDGPAKERHGMVVAVSPAGADVGRDVLKQGGNAVDAAVATAFALAVTWPAAGNLGGGGFMLVYPGGKAEPVVIDYRETAPLAATKTMFTKKDDGFSPKSVGVPGTVARPGPGPRPLRQAAVEGRGDAGGQAGRGRLRHRRGAGVVAEFRRRVVEGLPRIAARVWQGRRRGRWKAGDRLVQPDLAKTLRRIAEDGADGFYKGETADLLAAEMKADGGLITKDDLASYQAKERAPIHGTYRGYDVYAPPPPSSGGICLVEMLNILENFDLRKQGRWSPETLHLMIEAMRRAYCDRARYLGDPDFVKIPDFLTSKEYAKKLAAGIDPDRATPSADLAKDIPLAPEGQDTTHFSVIDADGMAVSNTYTLEQLYGCRIVVKGAGFLLNNEMGDFNWFPGRTTTKGRIGTEPNQIAPGKRMLSSQCPTVVARDGKVVLVTGSPGSRTIINTVLCVVVNVIEFDMDARSAVDAPRLHHQWFPDEARFEGMAEHSDAVKRLKEMGHVVVAEKQGDAHTIWVDPKTGEYVGAEDRRVDGKAAGY